MKFTPGGKERGYCWLLLDCVIYYIEFYIFLQQDIMKVNSSTIHGKILARENIGKFGEL